MSLEDSSYWNSAQWSTLRYTPIFPSLLSMMGSCFIIYPIVSGNLFREKPYHRLLFGLSCMDIIYSIRILTIYSFALQLNYPHPTAACTAYGFFSVFGGISAPIYNLGLSIYYYLSICKSMKPQRFSNRIERVLHAVAILFPLSSAAVGIIFRFFNPSNLGQNCIAETYPTNCEKGNGIKCIHGKGAKLYSWMAMTGPMLFAVLPGIIFTNAAIYLHVRKTMKKAERFLKPSLTLNTVGNNNSDNKSSTRSKSSIVSNLSGKFSAVMRFSSNSTEESGQSNETRRSNKPPDSIRKAAQRTKSVATHSFLYVFAFILTWCWRSFIVVISASGKTRQTHPTLFFAVETLEKLFNPMQGFFNYLVYVRANYLRWRESFRDKGRLWALRMATFSTEKVKDYKRRTNTKRPN